MENKQARNWICMLYPDNKSHLDAILKISEMPGSICMYHNAVLDDEGKEVSKKHCHCILQFEQGKWRRGLVKELDLIYDPDHKKGEIDDSHLFLTFKELSSKKHSKFVYNVRSYCQYLTHQNLPDKEEYPISDFFGSDREKAMRYCLNDNRTNFEKFDDMVSEFLDICEKIPSSSIWTFNHWYIELCKRGHKEAIYKNWYKFRDLIKEHTTYRG